MFLDTQLDSRHFRHFLVIHLGHVFISESPHSLIESGLSRPASRQSLVGTVLDDELLFPVTTQLISRYCFPLRPHVCEQRDQSLSSHSGMGSFS